MKCWTTAAATLEALERLRDGLEEACGRAAAETCERVREEARALCPVQSGALRASLRCGVSMEGATARESVSAGAPYAARVELGTLGRAPKPFLRPAFTARAPDAARILARELSRLERKGE